MINIIYALKNTINSKLYIGQTRRSLKKRWNNGHGYSHCIKLNNAMQKYGKNNFYYEILAICETAIAADYLEIFFIKIHGSINKGYNVAVGGPRNMLGFKHSKKSIKKMSKSHKGKATRLGAKHSDATKEMLRKSSTGNKNSLGHKHSKETKVKISKAKTGKSQPNSGSFKSGQNDKRHKNRLGKTWKKIDGKRVWSDSK